MVLCLHQGKLHVRVADVRIKRDGDVLGDQVAVATGIPRDERALVLEDFLHARGVFDLAFQGFLAVALVLALGALVVPLVPLVRGLPAQQGVLSA
mgnify:CR=1 FL=1